MRILFTFFLLFNAMCALTLNLNYGRENGEAYAVVNIKNNHPFTCFFQQDSNFENGIVVCEILGIPQSAFSPIQSTFVNVSYEMKDKIDKDENDRDKKNRYMVVYIKPSKDVNLKLFPSFIDAKTSFGLTVNKNPYAMSYQIIAYKKKLPFLENTDKTYKDSINFPIAIRGTVAPQLPELDINKKPLSYQVGKDLEAFLDIKSQMKQKKYKNALLRISDSLQKYPNSLFQKDMIYYAIVALSQNKDNQSQNALIQNATQWIKVYSSDDKIPEVMYLLANTYKVQNKINEAYYFYNRTIDEYPNSRYAPLSQMQVASALFSQSDLRRVPIIYREAYKNAKDIESASEIAISWAMFSLKNKDFDNAKNLIHKVTKSNPTFFVVRPDISDNLLKSLQEFDLFDEAGRLARYLSQSMPIKTDEHRDMLYLASNLLFQANDFDLAHEVNVDFLRFYGDTDLAVKVKDVDDSMLFNVTGGDNERLARYDYLIAKYPNTDNAKKATALKADLLMKLKRYEDVLNTKDVDKNTYNDALSHQAMILIDNKDCVDLSRLLTKQEEINLDVKYALQAFSCMLDTNQFASAHKLFSNLINKITKSNDQLKWLYLQSKTLFATKNNVDGIKAGEDALDLALGLGEPQYRDISFYMFNAMINLKQESKALSLSKKMQDWFKDDKRMLNVYFSLINLSEKNKDYLSLKNYTKDLINLQNQLKIYDYSPFANFTYIDILMGEKNYNDASKELGVVEKMELNNDDKQQMLYKKANVLYATNKDNKDILNECVKINADSSFGSLCKNALDLQNNEFEEKDDKNDVQKSQNDANNNAQNNAENNIDNANNSTGTAENENAPNNAQNNATQNNNNATPSE